MKKSKLLQNSKDLISRSFNPAKCKTSLRLAGSRLKLLRNKKEVQVKQMKREIAQLLESGQDQTARIRVEHVIREEKMMDAFDLLQIYCELFVARLPIIESQKNCPIDLKEAIASLVFAAPRCGDVPELLDVRKQVTAKYGKDFTTAAIELRPQCGVGRMLIEKLSASAPDGQTKLKTLTAIAEGQDVKWDPKSFGDKDYVPENENDTSGPSSFTKKSEQYAEPPHFEARPSNNNMMNTSPSNFSQKNDTTSTGPEKQVFSQTPGPSTPFQSEAKPAVLRNAKRHEDRYTGSSIDKSPERSRWNMEFKDANSAAQAAAESAERANMAARAAAELAGYSRFSRQYSTESHMSNVDILKDEGPDDTRSENEKIEGMKLNPKVSKSFKEEGASSSQGYYGQSASLKSKASVNEDEYYSRKDSLKDVSNSKMRAEKQSFKYETQSANDVWPEKDENIKGKIGREHSIKYSRSQSSASEDVNIFSNSEYQNDADENPFVGIGKIGSVNAEAPQASSHASDALFIDKSDSDSDDDRGLFDKGPTFDDQEFHLPLSFGQRSPERHTNYWSPRSSHLGKVGNPYSSLFLDREKSPSPDLSKSKSLRDDSGLNSSPLMFDESSDDDDMNSSHTKVDGSKDLMHNENSVFDSQNLPFSSDDESISSLKMSPKRNQVSVFDDESTLDDDGGRLNFGNLTGGFRHKGHNQPPFLKNQLDTSSVKKEFEETVATINTPTKVDERPERGTGMLYHKKTTRAQEDTHSESDSDVSEEEAPLPKKFGWKHVREVKTRQDSFLGTDISDLDEGSSKEESLTRKYHMQSGISRRTKASPASKPESHTNPRLRIEEELDDFDAAGDIARKLTPSSNSEIPQKTESHRKSSGKWETYEKPTSSPSKSSFRIPPENTGPSNTTSAMKHEFEARDSDASLGKRTSSSNARQEFVSRRNSSRLGNSEKPNQVKSTSEPYNLGKATSTATQESKIYQKSSAVEEPKAKASIGSGNASNKNESPRHVHPKLPDYDTLFQSLRMNRS